MIVKYILTSIIIYFISMFFFLVSLDIYLKSNYSESYWLCSDVSMKKKKV